MVMTLHDYKLVCPNYSMYVRGRIWEGGAMQCVLDRCVKDSFGKSVVCAIESVLHHVIGIYEKVDAYISPSKFLIGKFREHHFKKEIVHIPQPLFSEDFLESTPFDNSRPLFLLEGFLRKKEFETVLRVHWRFALTKN